MANYQRKRTRRLSRAQRDALMACPGYLGWVMPTTRNWLLRQEYIMFRANVDHDFQEYDITSAGRRALDADCAPAPTKPEEA